MLLIWISTKHSQAKQIKPETCNSSSSQRGASRQAELSANFQLWVLSIVGFSGSFPLPSLSLSLLSTLPCPYHNSILWVICEGNFYVVRIFVFAFSSSSSRGSSCSYNSRQTTNGNNNKNNHNNIRNNNNNFKPVTRLVNYTKNQQHRERQRQTATPTHR